ncbi:flagellar hook protein FlgE [Enterobacter ludwigii]|uniref:flagellar hook protein FlgE n=1 Tax=Enterobacter ludwigii TaxID=299767 RepID=UPI003F6EFFED
MSTNIAISGLNAVNEQLDSISNNIANSGTVGYKSGRTDFASMYAAGQPLGVAVIGTTESISKAGNVFSTGNSLDMAINGNGFFMMRDSTGTPVYSRAGVTHTDKDGYLVNEQGMRVQGYPVDAKGNLQQGAPGDLQLTAGSIPAEASTSAKITANLDSNAQPPANMTFDPTDLTSYNQSNTTTVYDSLGNAHQMTQYAVNTSPGQWQVHTYMDGTKMTTAQDPLEMTFDSSGLMTQPNGPVTFTATPAGAALLSIKVDYSGTTQYAGKYAKTTNQADGYASGTRTGQKVDSDGSVYATFSNGQQMLQGKVVLATFPNTDGLQSTDGTTWVETNNSGAPIYGVPGSGLNGTLQAGALESSNVDLTAELVDLMTAQRNYQANTKVISTDGNMMNSLFQAM